MPALYENLMRPLLFRQDPEKAHENVLIALKLFGSMRWLCRLSASWNTLKADHPLRLFGLSFPNAIGLAAGFDKNADCIPALAALGFGHIEVGTITGQKQPGNPRPRLFRYPQQEAIINRMGFNNDGAEAIAARLSRLRRRTRDIPLGINIGKTKTVPLEQAIEDYMFSFNQLADHADYIAINVSSPNTPELRKLQGRDYLPTLLDSLTKANRDRARKMGKDPIPMLLKIAPDLTFSEIDEILETLLEKQLQGIIATNTTVKRPPSMAEIDENGGLSGRPLHTSSVHIVNYIHRATEGRLPIIGVGGILDPVGAGRMMDAGASLIQIYSGMIYKGPFLAKQLAASQIWRQRDWI